MVLSNKKKNILFIIIALIIVIIISSFFLFWPENNKTEPKIISKTENIGGYEIITSEVDNTLINKECGFSISIPVGWTIKNNDKEGVGIFSPEIEFDESGGFLESARKAGGCIVGIEIRKAIKVDPELETDAEYLMNMIEAVKNGETFLEEEEGREEVVIIDGEEGLKTTYFKDGKERYVEIEIPVDNIIYKLSNGLIYSDKCLGEFDKIIETVVISK